MIPATQMIRLPQMREELVLYPGPVAGDGSPSWTLHDPFSNKFYRLSWPAFEILSRWHLETPDAIVESVLAETTLDIDDDSVQEMVEFLMQSLLLKQHDKAQTQRLLKISDSRKTSVFTWLLHHYLFFRVPLVQPDRFLDWLYPWVSWLGGRSFRLATILALLLGLFFVGRQWDVFLATFVDHFSISGLAAFGIALGFAKILHEMGHALVAKHFGCRVPTMGIAFLVMWPVLYTDVNEAWKLTARRQRLLVGSAGILSELTIAAWASLAWGMLPDGTLRGMAFTLAATTWISSLLINLSPFMRFDGYFLAMDALDIPNLHPRSFALARWHLREVLFNLGDQAPEYQPDRTRFALILFAWAVWIYRLLLFLGIAVLVYHFFIKIVGVLLFVVEIGWFVIKPLALEMAEWRKRKERIMTTRRTKISIALVIAGLAVLVVPWNGRVSAPAMLKAEQHSIVYTPSAAILDEILVANGDTVSAGQPLVQLTNPDLSYRQEQAQRKLNILRYELSSISFEDSFRDRSQTIAKEMDAAAAELQAVTQEVSRLILTAPLAGSVVDVSSTLQKGQWINNRDPILSVRTGAIIEAYVTESDLPRLQVGQTANFVPNSMQNRVAAKIVEIDSMATRSMTEPALTAPFGGTIPARIDRQTLIPDHAIYRVKLQLDDPSVEINVPLPGQVQIYGKIRSFAVQGVEYAIAVLIREWSP